MGKLLKAGFYRLEKSKLFWGLIIATIIMSYASFYLMQEQGMKLEQKFPSNLNFISFIIALFIVFFTSVEFSSRYY